MLPVCKDNAIKIGFLFKPSRGVFQMQHCTVEFVDGPPVVLHHLYDGSGCELGQLS